MSMTRDFSELFDPDSLPLLVAEVGLAHEGSLGLAHRFIDAVATTGADVIKFQTHIAAAESSQHEQFRVPFSYQDTSRYDYWQRTSFSQEQWLGLKQHAEQENLIFLSSPFSIEAVDMLEAIGIVAWKVGSGELASRRMIERMAATAKPIIASTGMSSWNEVKSLEKTLQRIAPERHVILQCTTEYPTEPHSVGMNIFDQFCANLSCPVGFSDHSGTIWPSLIASSRGARFLEVHVSLSSYLFGPDISSSLDIQDLRYLSDGIKFVHAMMQNPVDKDILSAHKAPLKKLFAKSAVARRNLSPGEILDESMVSFRKPGIGLTESELDGLLGRKLFRHIKENDFLSHEDFQ